MRPSPLGPRLAMLAGLVPPGARLADVGTDHALIPVHLLQTGRVRLAVATDIRPGPLQSARRTAARYGLTLDLRLCDGLSGVGAHECETVLIAGMGGETIASILAAASWTREDRTLILQPMTRAEALRSFLCESGYRIHSEHLVRDGSRIFAAMTARGGVMELSPADLYAGRGLPDSGAELYGEYLYAVRARLERERAGLAAGGRNPVRSAELRDIISEIDRRRSLYADGA